MHKKPPELEKRVLIYAPAGKDAVLASKVLESAAIPCFVCGTQAEMLSELECGAATLLTIEEALAAGALAPLAHYVSRQPTWSDIPILVLTHQGVDSVGLSDAIESLGNLTLLERPVRTAALISSVRSSMRARMRQYQARETDQRKDEFLASLAHELRNPLAPIRTSMSVLRKMYPAASGVLHIHEVVERQVGHLTRLIDDLLDVARITSGKVELHREKTTLAAVIAHTVEICDSLVKAKGHTLDVTSPPREIILDADPVRLVQSLTNILGNAIKFTTTPGELFLSARAEGQNIIFSIRDPGLGIEADALTGIFEMFAQRATTAKEVVGGLGIGLSLAKRFTEMHGGTIYAKSEGPGRGSEFVMTLPIITRAEPVQEITPRTASANAAENRRVLVVDDNRDGADMLLRLFEAEGYTVFSAYDGHEAVAVAQESQPDIVVMDIGMPGIDGYEAVRRIRQQPGGQDTLMIALTGWGQDSDKRLAREAGFDTHLVKPVDFDRLKNLLATA